MPHSPACIWKEKRSSYQLTHFDGERPSCTHCNQSNNLCIPWNLSFGGAQPASAVATACKSTVLKWSCGRTGAERWGSLEATENCATRTMCMCTWLDDRCSMLQPAIVMCVGNWQWFQCMGGGLVSSIIAIDSILQHLNTGGIWYGVVGIVPQWVANLAPSATNHGLIRRTKHGICLLAGFGRAWWWTRGHSINRSATKFGRLLPS